MAMLDWVEFFKTLESGFWLSETGHNSNKPDRILGEDVGCVTYIHIKTNQKINLKTYLHTLNDLLNTICFISIENVSFYILINAIIST